MSKVGKTLGITAVIAGIAGVTVGTIAAIKKAKTKDSVELHKCECGNTGECKHKADKSFEEQVEELHKANKDYNFSRKNDCTCEVVEGVDCMYDDTLLEEDETEAINSNNVECLKGKEDCGTCEFKDGCKLK